MLNNSDNFIFNYMKVPADPERLRISMQWESFREYETIDCELWLRITQPPFQFTQLFPISELSCVATNIFVKIEISNGSSLPSLQLFQKEEVWTVYRNMYTVIREKSIRSGILAKQTI